MKSGVQDGLALDQEIGGLSQMNHGGGHQAQAGMVVFVVVPAEEELTKTKGVFDEAKAVREARAVFQGAKLTFRIGIVVGNMGPECVLLTPRSARSKALLRFEVIVNLITATTTAKGLRVHAELDSGAYPARTKIDNHELAGVRLRRDTFHGDWNYEIHPHPV
jgi:hypothetical protein